MSVTDVAGLVPPGGSVTNVLQTSSVVYSDAGKEASSVDAAGRTTTMIYDYTGNLIETQYPDGTVTRTSYDAFGRQDFVQERAMTNGAGATTAPATRSTYDASGRVIQTEKFDGVTLTRSAADTTYFSALASYEPQCRMVTNAIGNVLTATRTFYDVVGRVQYSVDAGGR